VFSADNVINLMRRVRIFLIEKTILAAEISALRYQTAKSLIDVITAQGTDAVGPELSP
jgi:hypothetical protein